MKKHLRLAGFLVVLLLHPSVGHALDRSECKQYGGTANCWMPVIGPWKHTVCGEWGTGPTAVPVFLFTQVGADYVPDSDIDDRLMFREPRDARMAEVETP